MNYKKEWFGNIKSDLLAGLVVSMALIPEVIGFSIVAGVDPMVGVYSSLCMSIITALFGGRPGLISAAAGSMALVLASLVRDHGIEYMLAATILTGVIQVIFGFLKVGKLVKYIPKPVMTGFVNALGILMFISQVKYFDGPIILLVLGAIGIAIIYLFPKITKAIPSPIVAIVTVSLISVFMGLDILTLGDMGNITTDLPRFLIPNVPFNLETLKIIFPYAFSLSIVGLVESLLTAQLVDEETDTKSDKDKECLGQGLGNVTAGFFGGIAGCGMIGQTVVNLTYGGRGRLSTFSGGSIMLLLIIVLNKFVVRVPVVALGAVMVTVAIETFDFESIPRMKMMPITDTIVMIITVAIVLLTDNLAYGVVVGVLLSAIFFAFKNANLSVLKNHNDDHIRYDVKGSIFFATAEDFFDGFEYDKHNKPVIIDFTHSKVCDESAIHALQRVINEYNKKDIYTELVGLDKKTAVLINK